MDLKTILSEPENRTAIDNLAARFGIERAQVEAAVASVTPQLTQRIERNTLSRGGLADFIETLGHTARTPSLASPSAATDPAVVDHGNALLENILGTKDASRAVAAQAAMQSGLGATIIQALLPFIVQMVMSSLSRSAGGGLGDIVSKLPQMGGSMGGSTRAPSSSGDLPDRLPSNFPASYPGGPAGAQRPANPYGDLSDIIRRGGPASNVGGGTLTGVVRNILGSVLGFRGGGVMGWLFRLIVMRWGWRLVTGILGRLFVRR